MQLSIKYLVGSKKVRTFAFAFENNGSLRAKIKKEFFERLT